MDAPLFPKPMRSTNEKQALINQLLDVWNIITDQRVRLTPAVERCLFEFQKVYTKADLEDTLSYIVYKNKRTECPWHLRFEKFFDGEYLHFESLRSEADQSKRAAAAKKRQWRADAGTIALSQMRHEDVKLPDEPPKRVNIDMMIDGMRKAAKQ